MTIDTPQVSTASPSRLFLEVHAPDGSVRRKDLECGNVLIVGSSPACGLRLDSPQINGMHCTIEFKESGITIRDWDTEAGTFLDGRRVEEEKTDHGEFDLQIGGFRIHSRLIDNRDGQPRPQDARLPAAAIGLTPAVDISGPHDASAVDYETPGWLMAELERDENQFSRPHETVHATAEDVSLADSDLPEVILVDDECDPVEVICDPVEFASKPAEVSSDPVEVFSDPVEAISKPVEAISTPVEAISKPVETISKPVEAISKPIEAISEPAHNDSDPWDSAEEVKRLIKDISYPQVPDSYQRDAFQNDAAELLQVEVDMLRAELVERDERLRELEDIVAREADRSPADEDAVSSQEVESLVGRLEDLLAELEQSDARIASLNETLRMSEEAVQTADEERQQLEAWLGEVDRRVGQWEQEWHAERECLNKTIGELTEQRDRAEQQLAAGGSADSSGRAADQLVQELREQYARLQAAHQELEQERSRLLVRVEVGEIADVEGQVQAAVDQALREERLQLAQEKASLAREKSVILKHQGELQDHLQRKEQSADSADHRIRAFREHLREIHENEPHLNQGPTLSKRMGKLWRKLEGRPLDTD